MSQQHYKTKPGPNPRTEHVEAWYDYAPAFFAEHFGRSVSRNTLGKYIRDGFPVCRHGPKVEVPVFLVIKRPMTTREAMDRFLTIVRHLEKKLGLPTLQAV